jgi:hypothetical protein
MFTGGEQCGLCKCDPKWKVEVKNLNNQYPKQKPAYPLRSPGICASFTPRWTPKSRRHLAPLDFLAPPKQARQRAASFTREIETVSHRF